MTKTEGSAATISVDPGYHTHSTPQNARRGTELGRQRREEEDQVSSLGRTAGSGFSVRAIRSTKGWQHLAAAPEARGDQTGHQPKESNMAVATHFLCYMDDRSGSESERRARTDAAFTNLNDNGHLRAARSRVATASGRQDDGHDRREASESRICPKHEHQLKFFWDVIGT